MASVAYSISASSKTTTGQDDPSSNESFLTPATLEICVPVAVDPVKEILRTRESLTKASPSSDPGPCKTCNTPSGNPASVKHFARAIAVSGVVRAGLRTTEFPTASAGAILCRTKSAG
ncbi:unannotated protein [freshwater metagenome]|uniref:Unannotated protein n=1 Tax=freshwater metagenome TaxID=449393 RepID=A0A6J6SSR0_9ZZZZ